MSNMGIIFMNALQELERDLCKRFPTAKITVDAPGDPKGSWFLDIDLDGHMVIVEWRIGKGFGLSCSLDHSYGEGADELYPTGEAANARIVSLLLSRTFTAPPPAIQLRELRRERGISQEELAELLEVRQAAVSKLEGRNDALVSTVRTVIRSMGGTLNLIARFPDGIERALDIGQETAAVNNK